MKFWNEFKERCAKEYISSIVTVDKSKKERCGWMVLVFGQRVDDLIPGDKQNLMPFEETYYFRNKEEAEESGKLAWNKGHNVEIWKLAKRWK